MRSDHTPGVGVQAIDISGGSHTEFVARQMAASPATAPCPDCGEVLSTDPNPKPWWIAWIPPEPPHVRTAAAGRTRSPRWRAGTRRTRKMARRRPNPPPADPFANWTQMGWTEER